MRFDFNKSAHIHLYEFITSPTVMYCYVRKRFYATVEIVASTMTYQMEQNLNETNVFSNIPIMSTQILDIFNVIFRSTDERVCFDANTPVKRIWLGRNC